MSQKNPEINILLGGSTEVSRIKGISAAGTNPDMTFLTPALDAELIDTGKCITMELPPMTPEGIPSPALITRVCSLITGINTLTVNAGMKVKPRITFIETGLEPARDGSLEKALPQFDIAWKAGQKIGEFLEGRYDSVMISESIPGGTSTALSVMRYFDGKIRTSSSFMNDPLDIKENYVKKVHERTGKINSPERAMEEAGDYTQVIAVSILDRLKNTETVLAGGTQMSAVYRLAALMKLNMEKTRLWTTDLVYSHRKGDILSMVPENRISAYGLNFSGSMHWGLREYGKGEVREGAGMGGFLNLAGKLITHDDLLSRIDAGYTRITGKED